IRQMDRVRQAASAGLEARAAAAVPVRQVLASATVRDEVEFEDWMKRILAEELNVESVVSERVSGSPLAVSLDTELTPELKRKGALRELVRHTSALRKEAGLTRKDRIVLSWHSDSDFWKGVIAEYGGAWQADTLADGLSDGRDDGLGHGTEIKSGDQVIWIGLRKV
ncbi:hypothetical protein JW899_00980, partial [Candidatus Uhrbacteria bacterium]|nr:hypothetical protein [Candidatus Uhrbacteria bacterium]